MNRMHWLAIVAGVWTVAASAAWADVPALESKEGDLACAALLDMGVQGAKASNAPPEVQAALMGAYGVYLGRISKEPAPGDIEDARRIAKTLKTEEMNEFIASCLKKSAQIISAYARVPAEAPKSEK